MPPGRNLTRYSYVDRLELIIYQPYGIQLWGLGDKAPALNHPVAVAGS